MIIKVSVICYVIVILMSPGMIFYPYYRLIDKLPTVMFKPLGGCLMCFTGQAALWTYLITHFHNYNFFDHAFFISACIALVMLIDKIIDYE